MRKELNQKCNLVLLNHFPLFIIDRLDNPCTQFTFTDLEKLVAWTLTIAAIDTLRPVALAYACIIIEATGARVLNLNGRLKKNVLNRGTSSQLGD